MCPDFERHGKCPRQRCRYPHKSKCLKEKPKIPRSENNEVNQKVENVEQEIGRYYDKGDNIEQVSEFDADKNEEVYKRVKLGVLPSFIPLD